MENKYLRKLDNNNDLWIKSSVLENILARSNANVIIKEIFTELTKRKYFYYLAQPLFDHLLCYPLIFKEEILYMLNFNKNYLRINYNQLEVLIYNVPDSIRIIDENFKDFHLQDYKSISLLTKYYILHSRNFAHFLKIIINSNNTDIMHSFFTELTKADYDFSFNLIIETLRNLEEDVNVSSLPATLADFSYNNVKLRDFLVNNFEELMEIEKHNKMKFFCRLKNYLSSDLKSKYAYLYQLYILSAVPAKMESMLDILLEYQEEDFVKKYVQGKDISFLNRGTTSQVFKVGDDKVLKISTEKHIRSTLTRHFLLAPTEMKIIYNEQNEAILYIEKQDLLSKIYNGVPMNKDDLENYFRELDRLNIFLRDPHCVRRHFDNFGFLRDYHDATLVGVNSYNELPDWFKERPVVLFDIDMFTQKLILKRNI